MQDVRPTLVVAVVYPCFVCVSRPVSPSLFLYLYLHSVGLSQRSEAIRAPQAFPPIRMQGQQILLEAFPVAAGNAI